jgi:hypothetical protein
VTRRSTSFFTPAKNDTGKSMSEFEEKHYSQTKNNIKKLNQIKKYNFK